MKPFYSFFTLLTVFLVGCSVAPKQQAGSEALAEAICLYDKKIEYKSDEFSECLQSEHK